MPQIAQQDYIYFPILDGGEIPDELPQEIQNQLHSIAKRGNGLEVVFTEPGGAFAYKPVSVRVDTNSAYYYIYDIPNNNITKVQVRYKEIPTESE